MRSEGFSGQAPHSKVTVSWMHPHVHSLDGLRRPQHQQQQAQGL